MVQILGVGGSDQIVEKQPLANVIMGKKVVLKDSHDRYYSIIFNISKNKFQL